jgi:hypothetical protein
LADAFDEVLHTPVSFLVDSGGVFWAYIIMRVTLGGREFRVER